MSFEAYCTLCGVSYSHRGRHERTRQHREAKVMQLEDLLTDELQDAREKPSNISKDENPFVQCSDRDLRIAMCWMMEAYKEHFDVGNETIPEFFPTGLALNVNIREADWSTPEEDDAGKSSAATPRHSSAEAEMERDPAFCRRSRDVSSADAALGVGTVAVTDDFGAKSQGSVAPETVTLDWAPSPGKAELGTGASPSKTPMSWVKTSTNFNRSSVKLPKGVIVDQSRSSAKFTIQQCKSLATITLHQHRDKPLTKVQVRQSNSQVELIIFRNKSTTKIAFRKRKTSAEVQTLVVTESLLLASQTSSKGNSVQHRAPGEFVNSTDSTNRPSPEVTLFDDAEPVSDKKSRVSLSRNAESVNATTGAKDTQRKPNPSTASMTQNNASSSSNAPALDRNMLSDNTSPAHSAREAHSQNPASRGSRPREKRRPIPSIPSSPDCMYVWADPVMLTVLRRMEVLRVQRYATCHRLLASSGRLDLEEDGSPPAGQGGADLIPGFSDSIRRHMLGDCQDHHKASPEARAILSADEGLKYRVTAMHRSRKAYRSGKDSSVKDVSHFQSEYLVDGLVYTFFQFGIHFIEVLDHKAAHPERSHSQKLHDQLRDYLPVDPHPLP